MKKLFLSLVALMMATMSYAQSMLVATLSHGDKVKMYYGAGAFESAYNAAASGDVITLSGGSFTGFTITKAITVRGTGIDASTPSRISSNMKINIPASDTCRFSMEGIRFGDNTYLYLYGSCIEPYFIKCKFYDVTFSDGNSNYSSSSIKDVSFVNCKITNCLNLWGSTTAKFWHCFVNGYSNDDNYSSKAQFINSVIQGERFSYFKRSSFVNSILCVRYGWSNFYTSYAILPTETEAMNCVAFFYDYSSNSYKNSNIYSYMQGRQISCSTSTFEDVFKDYRGTNPSSQTFELTDEAKTKFLGTDSTEIGLYGGEYPYNSTPAYPHITKLNVAKQTTVDGKLSVEIEVSAAE